MSIGIAFSGGGIPAAISAACAWNAIVETHPSIMEPYHDTNLTVSTVSGGSIGYGLWINARDKIDFTPYKYNMTLEEMYNDEHQDMGYPTNSSIGAIHNLFSKTQANIHITSCNEDDRKRTVGEIVGDLLSPVFLKQFVFGREQRDQSHWWSSVIQGIFDNLCVDKVDTGDIPWLTSFALFNQSGMLDRSSRGTVLQSDAESLHYMVADMNGGAFENNPIKNGPQEGKVMQQVASVDALAYTSAFWSSNILTNTMMNLFFNKMLIKRPRSEFTIPPIYDAEESEDVIIMDGGVIDTTGIISLLRQRKEHIVAFYNNNLPLSLVSSPIAYLFGVDTTTDAMNSLKGPVLSQVFPSRLYPSVIRNLTDTTNGMAHLFDVDIVPHNHMGVESYRISSLLIVTNGKMDGFESKNKRMKNSPDWPDHFSYGLPPLDANLLCAYNDYKVELIEGKNILEGLK